MKGLSSCFVLPSPAFVARLVVLIVLGGNWFAFAPRAVGQGGRQNRSQGQPPVLLPASSQLTSPVQMQVAGVKPGTRAAAQAGASRIDQAVLNHLRQRGRRPQSAVSDSTFVRRIYLDLAGRIPTGDEVKAFLASPEPEKRLQLIDDLLASPDYVSNFYNMWADVLRLTERPEPNMIADPYLAYVKDAIRTNLAYDKWVYEMLTADGKIWDNPAVGYQLRDNGMPLPYVDNTVRIFLGTQIGCAQCHDHPFEDWSQRQFYELAAFTSGTLTRLGRNQFKDKKNPVPTLISQAQQQLSQQQVGPLQRLVRANTYSVQESKRKLKLPHDYAYTDGKPNQVVTPHLPWGTLPSGADEASPRKQFAAWLTSADNERFSRTVVNRLWQRLTGVGVVEPVDDFTDSNPPFSEELLTTLAEQLVEVDFDLKEVMRRIVYSTSYQLDSVEVDIGDWESFTYTGPALRRMTAEQVWDSILTLTVYNPWPFQRPTAAQLRQYVALDLDQVNFNQVQTQADRFSKTYLLNVYKQNLNKQHGYKGLLLAKASELPTPMPAGHFLRQFGQSDRASISGGTKAATVPQILTMFNGPITHSMLERGSRIYDAVAATENPREAVDLIFLTVLAREPTAEDRRMAASEVGSAKTQLIGLGNVIWALLNTREFLFVR